MSLCALWLEPVFSRDGVFYLGIVTQWHDTGSVPEIEFFNVWLPLFPFWLMKLLMDCGVSAEVASIGLNISMRSMLPLIAFGIAERAGLDKKAAAAAALLTAVHPILTKLSIEPQRDIIYLFWAGIAAFLLLAGIRNKKWYFWAGSGIFCAFALLTRHEAFEMLLMPVIALAVMLFVNRKDWKKHIAAGFLFYAGFLLSFSLIVQIVGLQKVQKRYCFFYGNVIKSGIKKINSLTLKR